LNSIVDRLANGCVLIALYMLISIVSEILFNTDLGFAFVSSFPLCWIALLVFASVIGKPIFNLLGIKTTILKLF